MAITIDGTGNITGLVAGGLPDLSVTNADLASDAVSTSKLLNASVTTAKLGTNEASGLAKAWVNFNGTGTVAIRASYNVSSITDVNVGNYRVNFTSAMANSEYVVVATSGEVDRIATNTKSGDLAASCDVRTTNLTGTYTDVSSFHVAIFR